MKKLLLNFLEWGSQACRSLSITVGLKNYVLVLSIPLYSFPLRLETHVCTFSPERRKSGYAKSSAVFAAAVCHAPPSTCRENHG